MHDDKAKMKKLEGMKARRRRKVGKDPVLGDVPDQIETPQNDQRTIDELLEELGEIKTEKHDASGTKSVAKKKKGKNQKLARPKGSQGEEADGEDGEEFSPRAAEGDADGDAEGEGEAERNCDSTADGNDAAEP